MTGPQFTSISNSFSRKRKQREPRFSWSWKTRGRLVRWPPSLCRLYFPCCLHPEVWRGSSGSKLAPHHFCGFNRKTSLFCFHRHRPDFQPLSVPSVPPRSSLEVWNGCSVLWPFPQPDIPRFNCFHWRFPGLPLLTKCCLQIPRPRGCEDL